MRKTSKATWVVFRVIRGLIRLFYGKTEIVGLENIPNKNAIIVANHAQMNGPIVGELFMPDNCYIWCAGQMMDIKEVSAYAFEDFWSQKPKWTHPFYRLLSHLIAPLAYCIFNNARTIAVWRDGRILTTFRETIGMLKQGRTILIFPEEDETYNNIVNHFQESFIDVAKLYYKRSGEELTFVPMYIAPKQRRAYVGQGITYDTQAPAEQERSRIASYLSDEITKIARELPLHTVVPYRNIPKKRYLTNHDNTEVPK